MIKWLMLIAFFPAVFFGFWASEQFDAFGGRYGPFTVTIKSQDGTPIEDIILSLVAIGPNGRGSNFTYRQSIIVNSGDVVTFPRGYVGREYINNPTGMTFETLGMNIGASHPNYEEYSSNYLSVPNQPQGTIELVDVVMMKNKSQFPVLYPEGFESKVKYDTDRGITKLQAQITTKFAVYLNGCRNYFPQILKLGHPELITKYLQPKIDDIASQGSSEAIEEAIDFKQECVKDIEDFSHMEFTL